MSSAAPWDIVKGHHHLATPGLVNWKAALEGYAAAVQTLRYVPACIHELRTSAFITGKGLYIFNTTRRPLFHRAPEDQNDRGAHSKAKEFILCISVCCLCFLKLVNLDLDLDIPVRIRVCASRA